jgi:hypothetical protein
MLTQGAGTESGNRSDDLIGGLRPDEGLGISVGSCDVVLDGRLEFSRAAVLPRRNVSSVSLPNQRSTMLIQEE